MQAAESGLEISRISDTENMENPENSQSTPLPDIQELTYYVHGTMMEPIRSVSLIRQGEKALVRIEPWDGEEVICCCT